MSSSGEESKDDLSNVGDEPETQMKRASKEPVGGGKKKRLELVGSAEDEASDYTASNFEVSEAKGRINDIRGKPAALRNITPEIDNNQRLKNYFNPN